MTAEDKNKGRTHQLLVLFLSTLYLSAFTFGGGYVIVTLMQKKFVDELHWISEKEMMDLVAIAQSSPGAIAVNGAVAVGYKIAGIPGVLVSVLGTVIPPFVILSLISLCYDWFKSNQIITWMLSGMQAGVGAVIAQVSWNMGSSVMSESDRWISAAIMLTAFTLNYFFGVNVIYIVLSCIGIGILRVYFDKKGKTI